MNNNQEDHETVNKQEDDQPQHDMVMPGFRFHPTEEELVDFYLRRKVDCKRFNVELIKFLELFRYDPWELSAGFGLWHSNKSFQSPTAVVPYECKEKKNYRGVRQRSGELPAGTALDSNKSFESPTVIVPMECKSLAATTIEMLNNGFYKSYDELYATLFDRPSKAIIGYPHSYAEGSSSHSEVPQVINITPPLKNEVSIDISERGKDPCVDSTASPQQREEIRKKKLGSSSLHLKDLEAEGISHGSNGLHADGINSSPGQYVSSDNNTPYVVDQQREEFHKGGELDRKKPDHISDGLNEIHSYGINSPMGQYVSIDIPCVVNQQWKEYIGGELERNKRDYSKIGESTLAITGQAVGSWLSSKFSGSSPTSWTENFVVVATIFGIAFTLSGIGLSRVNPRLSGITIKLGAVATASAIILALGSTVVPAVAWTAGAVAGFLIAVGVIMA